MGRYYYLKARRRYRKPSTDEEYTIDRRYVAGEENDEVIQDLKRWIAEQRTYRNSDHLWIETKAGRIVVDSPLTPPTGEHRWWINTYLRINPFHGLPAVERWHLVDLQTETMSHASARGIELKVPDFGDPPQE